MRQRLISGPDFALRGDFTGARVAVVTGLIFILAGLVKFVFHAWELRAFRAFGLPWPAALEAERAIQMWSLRRREAGS